MNSNTHCTAPTVLSTKKARIAGKKVTVETLKKTASKEQDIAYRVDGLLLEANDFWNLSPKFLN